ncbi:hypothetical protein HYE59_06275 [Aggregatibacter actinomycetemcomitans]|uniref:hypothetical protein n=1 Tax=Aggregatibacter actinomycetemcomitans TaxID=714 RepID=UPI00197C3DAF|nr:hypothetical protein [Aggregatibacter actinomycetemcomitans]MBN6077144.1 hypothetical protein [Aggregatibacter actinomycetemcomitans]
MFKEFDSYLNGYMTIDYWYDEGFDFARELLHAFSINDWNKLREELVNKNDEWKLKLAYVIDSDCGSEGILTLVSVLSTDNLELLEVALDSMRTYENIPQYENGIYLKKLIIEKVNKLNSHCLASKPVQLMVAELLKKINY